MKSVESKDKSMHSATTHRLHDQHVSVVSLVSVFHCSREENPPGKPWALFLAKLLSVVLHVKTVNFSLGKATAKVVLHAKTVNFSLGKATASCATC